MLPNETLFIPFAIKPSADLLQLPLFKDLSTENFPISGRQVKTNSIERIQEIGEALWNILDIDSSFDQARENAWPSILPIIIESDDMRIQSIPWEVLYHPKLGLLSKNDQFPISRSHQPTSLKHPFIDSLFSADFILQKVTHKKLSEISVPAKFVGRQPEREMFNKMLKDNGLGELLMIGPSGQGKTSLTGKLASDLARNGYTLITWFDQADNDWNKFILNTVLLLNKTNALVYDQKNVTLETKEGKAFALLSLLLDQFDNKLVVFFDNLSSVNDVNNISITAWLKASKRLIYKGLILFLTCCESWKGWPAANHWPLKQVSFKDFSQIVGDVSKENRASSLSARKNDQLDSLYQSFYGSIQVCNFFISAIQNMSTSEEDQLLASLCQADQGKQLDVIIRKLIELLSADEKTLLQRMIVYPQPVPIEGLIYISIGISTPLQELIEKLTDSGLLECTWNSRCKVFEYQLSSKTISWLKNNKSPSPDIEFFRLAASFQSRRWNIEQLDTSQALCLHDAFTAAEQQDNADRLVLESIVPKLNEAGLYQTAANDWLLSLCNSEAPKIKADAQRQMGDQHLQLNDLAKAMTFFEQTIATCREINDKSMKGSTLNSIGQIHRIRGAYDEAQNSFQQSLAIYRELNDKALEGVLLNNLATVKLAQGNLDSAQGILEKALIIVKGVGDKRSVSATLNNIGQVYEAQGDYKTALKNFQESLDIVRTVKEPAQEGTILNNIAQIFKMRGDYDIALNILEEALSIRRSIDDKVGEGATLNNISQIHDARGNFSDAIKFLEQALEIKRKTGDKAGEGRTLNNISQIYVAWGNHDMALNILYEALDIRREIGDKVGEGVTLNNISQIYDAREDFETALDILHQSLNIRQETGDKAGEGATLHNIGKISYVQGNVELALSTFKQALTIRQEIGDKSGEAITLNSLSQIFQSIGDSKTALNYLEQSSAIQKRIGDKAGLCSTLFSLGHNHAQMGKMDEALRSWATVYQIASKICLAAPLKALEHLAGQIELQGGLSGWENLANKLEIDDLD